MRLCIPDASCHDSIVHDEAPDVQVADVMSESLVIGEAVGTPPTQAMIINCAVLSRSVMLRSQPSATDSSRVNAVRRGAAAIANRTIAVITTIDRLRPPITPLLPCSPSRIACERRLVCELA